MRKTQCCCLTLNFIVSLADCISVERHVVCSEWMHGVVRSSSGSQDFAGHSERSQPVRGHRWAQNFNGLFTICHRYSILYLVQKQNSIAQLHICQTHSSSFSKSGHIDSVVAFMCNIHQKSSEHGIWCLCNLNLSVNLTLFVISHFRILYCWQCHLVSSVSPSCGKSCDCQWSNRNRCTERTCVHSLHRDGGGIW